MNNKNPPEMITQSGALHAPEVPDSSVSMGCMITSPPPCSLCEAVQGADVVVTPTKPATGKSTKILDEMEALPTSPRVGKDAINHFTRPTALGESESAVTVCPDCGTRYFFDHDCPKKPA